MIRARGLQGRSVCHFLRIVDAPFVFAVSMWLRPGFIFRGGGNDQHRSIRIEHDTSRHALPRLTIEDGASGTEYDDVGAEVVGRTEQRLNRKYFDESDLGNLLADVCVDMIEADIGMLNPGGIRKDFPQGDIEVADILDTNPFVDPIAVVTASGAQVREALEQSATHLRGLMQISAALQVVYDSSKPERERIISIKYNGEEIADTDSFNICVPGIIAKGGDHYDVFTEMDIISEHEPLGDMTIAYFRKHGDVPTPKSGRQIDLAVAN